MKKETKTTKKEEKRVVTKNENKNKKEDDEVTIKFNKKKMLQGVGIALVVLGVLGLAFLVSTSSNKNSKAFEFVDITIDDYLEKMQGSEASIIYIARPGCSWCQKESPIIKSVGSEYNLKIYYLNTDPFWDSANQTYTEEGKKFIDSAEEYKDGWGTPNTIIVGNGKIIDGEFSYVEKDKLVDLFVRNGFIDE